MRGVEASQAAELRAEATSKAGVRSRALWLAGLAGLALACGGPEGADEALTPATAEQALSEESLDEAARGGGKGAAAPVGLALEVDNGVGVPLLVRAGQTFYINQIDVRSAVASTQPEGVSALRAAGDFLSGGWSGVKEVDAESPLMPGATGFTHRRFYRGAAWMNVPSFFTVEPVDAQGRLTGLPVLLSAGAGDQRRESDDFFVRRFGAIHATNDCPTPQDCTGARLFEEEALLELRHARTAAKARTLTFTPRTAALRLRWSLRPAAPYVIPVEQVARPAYGYGFSIDVTPLTAPRKNGSYAPGSDITFQVTLRDGAGKALHPRGSLPTYNEFLFGLNDSGIQYYRAFFDATTTYYRRKHRERNMSTQILGPTHRVQPIRSIAELASFLGPDDAFTIATPERDGVFAQAGLLPPANKLFGDPILHNGGWSAPVSDTWTYRVPANAEPGTYLVTVKARRSYLGEDVPATRTIEIQVGSPGRTHAKLAVGNCSTCHTDGGELSNVLHGNNNLATCAGCHAPLGFELEGPIFVRLHFIHSRSERFDASTQRCATCHLDKQTTQRTSKAACLSCHKSYPEWHQQKFGPVESMYVGGGRESFQQCTNSCHTTHPGSGL
ncbi:cytochrome C [Myxococcaceae bacterium GXIMD 01537]